MAGGRDPSSELIIDCPLDLPCFPAGTRPKSCRYRTTLMRPYTWLCCFNSRYLSLTMINESTVRLCSPCSSIFKGTLASPILRFPSWWTRLTTSSFLLRMVPRAVLLASNSYEAKLLSSLVSWLPWLIGVGWSDLNWWNYCLLPWPLPKFRVNCT